MQEFYLEVAAEHIAYIKIIFESYEEVGIIRTVDRKKAIIVLLAMNDFVAVARGSWRLSKRIPLREISRPANVQDD